MSSTDGSRPEQGRSVGTVAEEAAKLADALAGAWSRAGENGSANRAGWATGSPECCVCPVCRALAAVRTSEPVLAVQLGEAVSGLRAALRTVADAYAATAAATTPQDPSPADDGRGDGQRGSRPERHEGEG